MRVKNNDQCWADEAGWGMENFSISSLLMVFSILYQPTLQSQCWLGGAIKSGLMSESSVPGQEGGRRGVCL